MAMRIPRGYAVDRPYYQEISKGERLSATEIPMTAYTGLAHMRVDELHHDPVVLEPGTLVGLATGGPASGTLLPAMMATGFNIGGTAGRVSGALLQNGSSEGNTNWGLPGGSSGNLQLVGDSNNGYVKPIGVIYQPIYSFILDSKFTNYKRNDNVGVVTNYVIQVPVTNAEEANIQAGDLVMVGDGQHHGLGWTSTWNQHKLAGRYARYDSSANLAAERVVGRCLSRLHLGVTTESAGNTLKTAVTNSTFTISTQAQAAFKGLEKVQTVPGLSLGGSGTGGIPGWLLGARSSGTEFSALTILIRL